MKKNSVPTNVNLAVVRGNALLTITVSVVVILTRVWWLPALLAVDFAVRGFLNPRWSIFSLFSSRVLRPLLPFEDRSIFFPPKQFAARVGMAFAGMGAGLFLFDQSIAAVIVIAVLALFATLECFLNFCMGCVIYNALIAPFRKRRVFGAGS